MIFKIFLTLFSMLFSFSTLASVARDWNEELLHAIRLDQARPTVHARNLYHVSAAMWDAWATYDSNAYGVFYKEKNQSSDIEKSRQEAISYAAYRILNYRFSESVNSQDTLESVNNKMIELGYDISITSTQGSTPAEIGNAIAALIIEMGSNDGSNEDAQFENQFYLPVNEPLLPDLAGNPDIEYPNRWQPLALEFFVGQSGVFLGEYPEFLGPEWGHVETFSLTENDMTMYQRGGNNYPVYLDPGPPPYIEDQSSSYKEGFEQVIEFSSFLDPNDGKIIDISPRSNGNNELGTNNGNGHELNPITGQPYAQQNVLAGDYYRVLAEFWADGPDSETPPGHWFTILNFINDSPDLIKQINGKGEILDDLQWDVKSYLALSGAMHDSAIAAWSVKGWYDYIRPVSAIRYMCDNGQSNDENLLSFSTDGINLHDGYIQLVDEATTQTGGIHSHLSNEIGKIAVKAWKGPDYIDDPSSDVAGVGWILCENWWPYQRPSFVTPPFAGYVSGHSTFSRAAAEVLTQLTGDAYFPGGLGTFHARANEFLVFENGPSQDINLEWATYQDAADECSLSRIYGGIHPTADDIPGRFMGFKIGHSSFQKALTHFNGDSNSGIVPFIDFDHYWNAYLKCENNLNAHSTNCSAF